MEARLFQFAGLSASTVLAKCWVGALVAAWIASLVLITVHLNVIFFDDDPIGKLTDIIQALVPFCTYLTILIETLRTSQTQRLIAERLIEIDAITSVARVAKVRQRRLYLTKFTVVNGLSLFFELLIIVSFYRRNSWTIDWAIKLPTFILNRLHDCHFMLLVDQLRCRIERLNEGLRETPDFRTLKHLYDDIYGLSHLIASRTGWSILATVTSNFIELTINLYWVYAYLHMNELVLESYYYPVPRVILLVALFYTCENCCRQARLTQFYLYGTHRGCPQGKSMENTNNAAEIVVWKRFIMQIQESPITITANGFFSLDYRTATSIIATNTLYMLLFVQFMPNNDDK